MIDKRTYQELEKQIAELQQQNEILRIQSSEQITKELNLSEGKFKSIFDNMADVMWSLSYPDFKPILISKSAENLYEYSSNQFLEDPMLWATLTHPDDIQSTELSFLELERTGKSTRECRIICPSGKIKYIIDRTWIIFDNNVPIRVDGITKDITERKIAELKLEKNQENLKISNATKDKFFSIIAHDLSSPLKHIIGFSELLVEDSNKYDATETEKFLTIINSSGGKLLVLLDNLLNWANSQTGQMNFKPEKQVFSTILDPVIKLLKPSANKKNITINTLPTTSNIIFADANMIKTILRNLISNAIKFTKAKGKIDIAFIQKDNFIEIIVSDNGVGMSEETRNNLFSLETNATAFGTAKEKGSGLGLILCKEFVEKHHGEICVESELGKGSVFKFTLPLTQLPEIE